MEGLAVAVERTAVLVEQAPKEQMAVVVLTLTALVVVVVEQAA